MKKQTVITVMSLAVESNVGAGYLRRVIEMNKLFLKTGYDPLIIAPWKFKERITDRFQGIKRIRIPRLTIPSVYIPIWDDFFSYSLTLFIFLFFLCLFKNVKLIHAHNPPDSPTFSSILIGKIFKIPVIYDIHDFWIYLTQVNPDYYWHPQSIQNKLGRLVERFCLKHATTILVVSWTMKQVLIKREIPSNKIFVIRQPCDLALFDPKRYNGEFIRKRYSLENHRPVITYIGKMESFRRGLEILICSMKPIIETYPEAVLLLVGKVSISNEFEELAKKIDLPNSSVIFSGWISNNLIPEIIAVSDILVAPFLNTPDITIAAPHKIYEYMAMEKPIVISETSEFKYMLKESAFFVKPGDVKDLAQNIIKAYENADLSKLYARRARKLLLEKFSWNITAKKLKKIYRSLLKVRA